jgi:hypothetical protein
MGGESLRDPARDSLEDNGRERALMDNQVAIIAVCLSAVTLIVMVGEKIFGGGNRLAGMFAKLDKETTASIAAMRAELSNRVDAYEDSYRVGLDAIQANIHAMQIGLLEFRA